MLLAVTGKLVRPAAVVVVEAPLVVVVVVVVWGKRMGRAWGVPPNTVVVCRVGVPIAVLSPGVTCVDDTVPVPVVVATAGPARTADIMIRYRIQGDR